jgi:hypothetical protein
MTDQFVTNVLLYLKFAGSSIKHAVIVTDFPHVAEVVRPIQMCLGPAVGTGAYGVTSHVAKCNLTTISGQEQLIL